MRLSLLDGLSSAQTAASFIAGMLGAAVAGGGAVYVVATASHEASPARPTLVATAPTTTPTNLGAPKRPSSTASTSPVAADTPHSPTDFASSSTPTTSTASPPPTPPPTPAPTATPFDYTQPVLTYTLPADVPAGSNETIDLGSMPALPPGALLGQVLLNNPSTWIVPAPASVVRLELVAVGANQDGADYIAGSICMVGSAPNGITDTNCPGGVINGQMGPNSYFGLTLNPPPSPSPTTWKDVQLRIETITGPGINLPAGFNIAVKVAA